MSSFCSAYLPPIGYMVSAIKGQVILIEAWETYSKQTCRNHCNIYGPNGKQTLTIPVIKVNGNHTQIRDIRISDSHSWQNSHWRSIVSAYSNSPYFLYYSDSFIPIFRKHFIFLLDLNYHLLEIIVQTLKLSTTIQFSQDFMVSESWQERELLVSKKYRYVHPRYQQVFSDRYGFISNLSIIDLIFNMGPESVGYLTRISA